MAALAVGVSFAVGICGTSTADAATAATVQAAATSSPAVVVTDNDITINGIRYSQEAFQKLLDDAAAKENGGRTVHAAVAPAIAAGAYFIPGVGEVLLLASGGIILGGVTLWGASWLVHKIKNYLANSGQAHEISDARNQLPGYIKKSDGNVDMGKFKTRVRGSSDLAGPKGWKISPDRDGHRGSKWKVLDPKGNRKASVKDNGEIVGK